MGDTGTKGELRAGAKENGARDPNIPRSVKCFYCIKGDGPLKIFVDIFVKHL